MLIQCPECDLQVSDKANTCPHCGYPLKPDVKLKSSRKPNKRRRLPNGFGQISEIKETLSEQWLQLERTKMVNRYVSR